MNIKNYKPFFRQAHDLMEEYLVNFPDVEWDRIASDINEAETEFEGELLNAIAREIERKHKGLMLYTQQKLE